MGVLFRLMRVAAAMAFFSGLLVAFAMSISEQAFSQALKGDRLPSTKIQDRIRPEPPLPRPKPKRDPKGDREIYMEVQQQESPPVKCGPLGKLEDILMRKYGESRGNAGLSNDGAVLGIYSSPAGSWTAVIISPNGVGCVVASGEHWSVIKQQMPGADS